MNERYKSKIPNYICEKYEIIEWKNAIAVLRCEHPNEWDNLLSVLSNFQLSKDNILTPGGNKSPIARSINGMFNELGWHETAFDITIRITHKEAHPGRRRTEVCGETEYQVPTHHVDYYKNKVAIETEWNNKDPFFDRDLNNFRILYEYGVIDVGIIITRSWQLEELLRSLGKGASYGRNTTHMDKLKPRIFSNASGGCPVLAFGITSKLYVK